MKVFHNSILNKVLGVIRFLVVKTRYGSVMTSSGLSLFGSKIQYFIEKGGSVTHGYKNIISDFGYLYSKGDLKIGDRFFINTFSRIVCHESIRIGDDVTIGAHVTIIDHDHDYSYQGDDLKLSGYVTDPISIGNNVWISDKVTILKGASIGNNVILGAGAVVSKNIPDNSLAAGIPAKVIKSLVS